MTSPTTSAVERGLPGSLQHSLFQLDSAERRKLTLQLLWSLPRSDLVEIKEILAKTLQKDIIAALPLEIAVLILAKLPLEDLLQCSLVSRTWASRCNDQDSVWSLWTHLCKTHRPPIRPASTSWTDLQNHRVLMHQVGRSRHVPFAEAATSDSDDSATEHDPITAQGGLGGGGGLGASTGPFAPVRRYVYERSQGGFMLPQYSVFRTAISPSRVITSTASPASPARSKELHAEPPILPDMGTPGPTPQVNYRHLYLVDRKLSRRIRDPHNLFPTTRTRVSSGSTRPITLDAVSSFNAGGLPGHREWIYTLSLVRHRMTIPSPPDDPNVDLPGRFDSFMSVKSHSGGSRRVSERGPQNDFVEGRDWLFSGSRDKTIRLWSIDTDRPRVVRIFEGGHTGSVLSLATVILRSPSVEGGHQEKLFVVSGGSDGRICLWDVEGDTHPIKTVEAHSDSVLCVRADRQHVVSCSKDRVIKVFKLPDLDETLFIRIQEAEGWGAVNAVGLSQDYIVAGSGDRTLRVWCIRTGVELAKVRAHRRGVAAIHFDPHPPFDTRDMAVHPTTSILGIIATGSSDAAIKIFNLVLSPSTDLEDTETPFSKAHLPGQEEGTESDGTSYEDDASVDEPDDLMVEDSRSSASILRLEKSASCRAPCICPPGLSRPQRGHRTCGRCLNKGHSDLVRSVCLTPAALFSASYDGSVRVWDRNTGRALAKLSEESLGRTFSVVANKLYVISAGADSRITLWNIGQGLDTAFVDP